MTLRVAVSRRHLPGPGLGRLAEAAEIVTPESAVPSADELRALAAGADALLCLGNDRIDADLLDAGAGLKVVALASAGYDAVDLVAAAERGVVVTHTPGVLAETTADLAFALILMARRRLLDAADSLRSGGWETFRMDGYLGLDVYGATLGVIGYGEIGRAVARRAAGFGMEVLAHTRTTPEDAAVAAVDLPELLRRSDVVSLHVPLTPATRHLIGADELAAMKPTATLVNTARGGVVDQSALLHALRTGEIHSAGLDVFSCEPLPAADVEVLAGESKLVALPHIGSATEQTRAAMVGRAAANVLAVLGGAPPLTPVPAA